MYRCWNCFDGYDRIGVGHFGVGYFGIGYFFIGIIVLAAIIALLFFIFIHNKKKKNKFSSDVEETLKMRYIKGELTEEEYERMKKVIK